MWPWKTSDALKKKYLLEIKESNTYVTMTWQLSYKLTNLLSWEVSIWKSDKYSFDMPKTWYSDEGHVQFWDDRQEANKKTYELIDQLNLDPEDVLVKLDYRGEDDTQLRFD